MYKSQLVNKAKSFILIQVFPFLSLHFLFVNVTYPEFFVLYTANNILQGNATIRIYSKIGIWRSNTNRFNGIRKCIKLWDL